MRIFSDDAFLHLDRSLLDLVILFKFIPSEPLAIEAIQRGLTVSESSFHNALPSSFLAWFDNPESIKTIAVPQILGAQKDSQAYQAQRTALKAHILTLATAYFALLREDSIQNISEQFRSINEMSFFNIFEIRNEQLEFAAHIDEIPIIILAEVFINLFKRPYSDLPEDVKSIFTEDASLLKLSQSFCQFAEKVETSEWIEFNTTVNQFYQAFQAESMERASQPSSANDSSSSEGRPVLARRVVRKPKPKETPIVSEPRVTPEELLAEEQRALDEMNSIIEAMRATTQDAQKQAEEAQKQAEEAEEHAEKQRLASFERKMQIIEYLENDCISIQSHLDAIEGSLADSTLSFTVFKLINDICQRQRIDLNEISKRLDASGEGLVSLREDEIVAYRERYSSVLRQWEECHQRCTSLSVVIENKLQDFSQVHHPVMTPILSPMVAGEPRMPPSSNKKRAKKENFAFDFSMVSGGTLTGALAGAKIGLMLAPFTLGWSAIVGPLVGAILGGAIGYASVTVKEKFTYRLDSGAALDPKDPRLFIQEDSEAPNHRQRSRSPSPLPIAVASSSSALPMLQEAVVPGPSRPPAVGVEIGGHRKILPHFFGRPAARPVVVDPKGDLKGKSRVAEPVNSQGSPPVSPR